MTLVEGDAAQEKSWSSKPSPCHLISQQSQAKRKQGGVCTQIGDVTSLAKGALRKRISSNRAGHLHEVLEVVECHAVQEEIPDVKPRLHVPSDMAAIINRGSLLEGEGGRRLHP